MADKPHVRRVGRQAREARQAKLSLYAALGGQQLVPFVHNDGFEGPEVLLRVLLREQQ